MDRKLCMIPGPVEFHEDVLQVMGTHATSHIDPSFINIFGESIEMLRKVLLAKDAQPFIIAGSGTLGWDQVASNLVQTGEKVLVVNTGLFGDRFGDCLTVYGADVTHLRCEIGSVPSLTDIKKAVETTNFRLVTLTHVDTSTGVLTDIKTISKLIKEISPSTLVVVDGVCSVGGEEIRMHDWNIDVVLTGSQKALGTPPGLCVVLASELAMNVFKNRTAPVPNYYISWKNWLPIMHAYEKRAASYFATPPVQLIMALHVSLKQILSVSMEKRFQDHANASAMIKEQIAKWGLKQVPQSPNTANTLTAIYYPANVTAPQLLPKLTSQGIVVAGGLHPQIAAKYFRIGHMGLTVTDTSRGYLDKTLSALKTALTECGCTLSD